MIVRVDVLRVVIQIVDGLIFSDPNDFSKCRHFCESSK